MNGFGSSKLWQSNKKAPHYSAESGALLTPPYTISLVSDAVFIA